MVENGYIRAADGEAAKASPLEVTIRPRGNYLFASEFFAEEVRRNLIDMFGAGEALRGRPVGPHDARSEAAGRWRARR